MPGLTIGDTIPNLEAESTHGKIKLYDQFGDSWAIIFSHPGDFTPVCTTELGKMAEYSWKFPEKGVKLVVYHATICLRILSGLRTSKPTTLCGHFDISIRDALNMMESNVNDYSRNQVPSRSLHIVGPDTKVKLSFLYPANTGRNMDEVVRVLESLQKANKHKVATSANWKSGDPMIISPLLSQDKAKKMFPQGYKTMDLTSKKEYLRFTDV